MPNDARSRWNDRIIAPVPLQDELPFENLLRPTRFNEFIGQTKLKEKLAIYVEAAKGRGEPLDHVLLYGPPGLGKTTLAGILAHEMGVQIRVTSGPAVERPGDLVAILSSLEPADILFIDEIHRLHPSIEEVLYPAMEDYRVDIVLAQGPNARTIRLKLPRFTLIGATTRIGLLTAPLRGRFGIIHRLDYYAPEELQAIVIRSAGILEVPIEPEAAFEIARRARGTPRIANRLLRRVRDYAEVRADGAVTKAVALQALELFEVDEYGFDDIDRKMMQTLIEKFDGGPVGLNTIAAAIAEDKQTIEEIYEPYLMQIGFLKRTPRGRVATRRAFEYFGYKGRQAGLRQRGLLDIEE